MPSSKAAKGLAEQIEKVDFLKELGADRLILPDLPLAGLEHFARRMTSRKPAALARIKDPHRTIEVACFLRLAKACQSRTALYSDGVRLRLQSRPQPDRTARPRHRRRRDAAPDQCPTHRHGKTRSRNNRPDQCLCPLRVAEAVGAGRVAIADGTHVPLRENNLIGAQHIRYGGYGGIAYHHISDSYIALFTSFIPCGVWEAIHILDGLIKNRSTIQPDTLHADTQGQSEPVFGLCRLLGIELMPRMRNWDDVIFYRPGNPFATSISTRYSAKRSTGG